MKKYYLLPFYFLFFFLSGYPQTAGKQYARSMASIYNPGTSTNFLVFKPADSASQGKHPLIIFLHGAGEIGSGNPSSIAGNVGSIPYLCANNASMRFTVNGVTSSFYVLSPQCTGSNGFFSFYVKDMWQWAVNNLNVDTSRVYLTGLSYGGGGVWSFMLDSLHWTKRIAAISTMGAINGGYYVTVKDAMIASDMSSWAFHGTSDGTVSPYETYYYSSQWGFENPNWRWTYYSGGNHADSWIKGSDTAHHTYTVDSSNTFLYPANRSSTASFAQNPNLYEWFLTKSRAITTPPPSGGTCKVVWTSTPGSLGDIKTNYNLEPCDTLKIKSGSYGSLNISNSRFDDDVFVVASDSGVTFTGAWNVSNVKNVVFRNFKFRNINGRAINITSNTDSCVFQGFNMYDIHDYVVHIDGTGMSYNGTAATRFDGLKFIDDTIRAVPSVPVFAYDHDPVTSNMVLRRVLIDSTYGALSTALALNYNSINLLIEDCRFTNINLGGVNHNAVMFIQGNGIIRNNYGFNIQGDFIRSRPYTIDSAAGHSNPDTLWVYNNRLVSSAKYAFAEMRHDFADTTTNTNIPNVRTGIGVFLNNTAGNLRSRDYWQSSNVGGGGSMFDVYDWMRRPIFKNNLAFRLYMDSVPDPANPPAAYTFNYILHDAGGLKPAGQPVFGDTSNNIYRHIPAQLGIGDTLVMKISDNSIARHAGSNIYSYKFNTDFEGDLRGTTWDVGADQNTSAFQGDGPYYGMDSVMIGGRKCLVKRPTEDPLYTSTKKYPLILEVGDQEEYANNNPSGLDGLFKSGTPKLLKNGVNIYPDDKIGHPIYYIMAKIQPLHYGDVAFPKELTPFVTGVMASYPIDSIKDINGMYQHIMLVGAERGADTWFNCTNWDIANELGDSQPAWVYKIKKIVTSRVNNINNGNPTSNTVWQTFNGRSLRYFEPADNNTLPDSTKARIARNSNAYQQLFRFNAANSVVYDSMYSVKGIDTITNIYKLLVDDSSTTENNFVFRLLPVGTAEHDMVPGLVLYPNPAGNSVFISSDKGIRSIIVYSLTGQQMLRKTTGSGIERMIQLNTGTLPSGIYILQIRDVNGNTETRKLMKQ